MALRLAHTLPVHAGAVKALDVTGDQVVTGGADGHVVLLDPVAGEVARLDAHRDLVNSVRANDTGVVASGSKDGGITVWDPDSGERHEVGSHDPWVMGVAWGPEGDRLASCSEDGTVRVWAADGGELARVDLGCPGNAIDWYGGRIAVAGGDRTLYLVDPEAPGIVEKVRGAGQMLWSVRFSPGGETLAWAGRDRTVLMAAVSGQGQRGFLAHEAQVWSVAWHPDGTRLASASADGSVALWGPDGTPQERLTLPVWARAAVFVGDRVVAAGQDGLVRVFEDDGTKPAAPAGAAPPVRVRECAHWDPEVTETDAETCEECDSTEQLRLCVTCGHVGCCESQLGHGTQHWEDSGHPNTVPVREGQYTWRWCYADDDYVKRVAGE